VKFSLRRREPSVAKIRNGITEAHVQRTWEAIRSGPKKLTHKQVVALDGKLYEDFALSLEDNPGSAAVWQRIIADNAAAQQGAFAHPLKIFEGDHRKRLDSLEQRFGRLVDVLLQREGLIIDQDSRSLLLREGGIALTDAV
jgi:hypothetical protein